MRRFPIIVTSPLVVSLLLAAHAGNTHGQSIVLRGATTTEALIAPWAKEFKERNPGSEIDMKGTHQQEGFRALLTGKADILMAARGLKQDEILEAKHRGIQLLDSQLGHEGIAIVVNPANSVNDLTVEQLAKLWSGEYTSWDQVGGQKVNVSLIVGPPDSAMRDFLEHDVLKRAPVATGLAVRGYAEALGIMFTRAGALTYCRTELAHQGENEKKLKILGIKKDPGSPAVKPSSETAKNGSYHILRPVSLVYDGARTNEPVKKFVEFCVVKSQKMEK